MREHSTNGKSFGTHIAERNRRLDPNRDSVPRNCQTRRASTSWYPTRYSPVQKKAVFQDGHMVQQLHRRPIRLWSITSTSFGYTRWCYISLIKKTVQLYSLNRRSSMITAAENPHWNEFWIGFKSANYGSINAWICFISTILIKWYTVRTWSTCSNKILRSGLTHGSL